MIKNYWCVPVCQHHTRKFSKWANIWQDRCQWENRKLPETWKREKERKRGRGDRSKEKRLLENVRRRSKNKEGKKQTYHNQQRCIVESNKYTVTLISCPRLAWAFACFVSISSKQCKMQRRGKQPQMIVQLILAVRDDGTHCQLLTRHCRMHFL